MKSSFPRVFVRFGMAALLFVEGQSLLQGAAGSIDPSFDVSSYLNAGDIVRAMVIQPDGKILIGGSFAPAGSPSEQIVQFSQPDGGSVSPPGIGFHFMNRGTVQSLALLPGGGMVVGGDALESSGPPSGMIWLKADGVPDATRQCQVSGIVCSVVVLSSGKTLIGGDFTEVAWLTRNRMAMIDENGMLSPGFNPDVNGTVRSIAVQPDGKILIGGDFTMVGGVTRNRIARLNSNGTLDIAFDPNVNGIVRCVEVQPDGQILMGGDFTSVGVTSRTALARLTSAGSLDTSFTPVVEGNVCSLVLQADGAMVVGSNVFDPPGGDFGRVVRVNADGSLNANLSLTANGGIYAIALRPDGRVLVGGGFTQLQGGSGSPHPAWVGQVLNPFGGTPVPTLTVSGRIVHWLRSGRVSEVSQVTFEKWNGLSWTSLGAGIAMTGGWRGDNFGLNPWGSWIRAAGITRGGQGNASSGRIEQIASYGTIPDIAVEASGGIALTDGSSLNFGTTSWLTTADPAKTVTIRNTGSAPLDNIVAVVEGTDAADFTLGAQSGTTLEPGASMSMSLSFTPHGGGARAAILHISSSDYDEASIAINLGGTGLQEDAGFAFSTNNMIESMALRTDGKILIGGWFTTVNGALRNYLGLLNANGSLDAGFAPTINGAVTKIVQQADGKILVGGYFTAINGVPRRYLARLNADGGLDAGFAPSLSGYLNDFVEQGAGKILLASAAPDDFAGGGESRSYIRRLNADGSEDAGFNTLGTLTTNYSYYQQLLVQPDGKIWVRGSYSQINGNMRRAIARLNADGGVDLSIPYVIVSSVTSFALQKDGKLLLAGDVVYVPYTVSDGIKRLNLDGTTDTSFNASGYYGDILAVQADGKIFMGAGGVSIGGAPGYRVRRLNADGTLDGNFNTEIRVGDKSALLQPDGKLIVSGSFSPLGGGTSYYGMVRLPNNIPASQTLAVPDMGRITWQRNGGATDVERVFFERWTGSAWVSLGGGAFVSNNWQVSGLDLPAAGRVRVRGTAFGRNSSEIIEQTFDYNLTGAPLSALKSWRVEYFGDLANSGNGANSFSYVGDGVSNLMKFASGQIPTQPGTLPGVMDVDASNNLTFTYPRAKAAVASGATFVVEWSETLAPGSWSNTGVTEEVISDDVLVQQVRATIPAGSGAKRFVRLRVIAPAE